MGGSYDPTGHGLINHKKRNGIQLWFRTSNKNPGSTCHCIHTVTALPQPSIEKKKLFSNSKVYSLK